MCGILMLNIGRARAIAGSIGVDLGLGDRCAARGLGAGPTLSCLNIMRFLWLPTLCRAYHHFSLSRASMSSLLGQLEALGAKW